MSTVATSRLDAADRAAIDRARELADSINHRRTREYSGEDEQRFAFAKCLGASGALLNELLGIITRLDGAS